MIIENGVLITVENNDIDNNGHFEVPSNVISIGKEVFFNNNKLQSITIPRSVISIGIKAFSYCCRLESISLYCETISESAFSYCRNLISVELFSSVKNIGNYAFYGCSRLNSISLFSESIGLHAFSHCTSLASVVLFRGVKNIGSGAFESSTNLQSISIADTVNNIGYNSFRFCSNNISFKIQADTRLKYEQIKSLLPKELSNQSIYIPKEVIKTQKIALKKLHYCLSASPTAVQTEGFSMKGLLEKAPLELWGHIHGFLGKDYPYQDDAQKDFDNLPIPQELNEESINQYRAECEKIVIAYIKKADEKLNGKNSSHSLSLNCFFNVRNNESSNVRESSCDEEKTNGM